MPKITKAQHERILAAVAELNAVREEIEKKYPDAQWYLEDSSNLNLMTGASHDSDRNLTSRQDRVIFCYHLEASGGGGW